MNLYKINTTTNQLLLIGEVDLLDPYSNDYFAYQPQIFIYKPITQEVSLSTINKYRPGFWILKDNSLVRVEINMFVPGYCKEIYSFDEENVIGLVKYNNQKVYYDQYL